VSTFRPPVDSSKRPVRFGPLLCVVGLAGALALAGCSSKKAADNTGVDVTTAETIAATTAASAETSPAVAETTLGAEALTPDSLTSDSVTSDSAASDSTLAAGAAPASVDPQASMEAAIVAGMSSQLGVTDPKQLACVGESVKGVDFANPEGQGKILRGVLKCAPDAMAVQGAKSLRESNPSVTEEQSVCVVKSTFEVLGGMPDGDLVSAMSSSKLSPEIVEATLAKAKGCGLSEAEIRKALQQ
jgi:hypothetical protein